MGSMDRSPHTTSRGRLGVERIDLPTKANATCTRSANTSSSTTKSPSVEKTDLPTKANATISTRSASTSSSTTKSPSGERTDLPTTTNAASARSANTSNSATRELFRLPGTTKSPRITYITPSPPQTARLEVALPLVAVVFVLLLFVCSILLWKKTCKRKKSQGDSLKSQNNEMKQELGEVKGKFKDPYPVEHPVTSMNHYTDPNSDENRNEGALTKKNKAVGEAQYAKVDKKAQRKSKDTGQNGKVPPSVHYTVDAQGSHGYEEAIIRGTQSNDGYEEAKVEGTQNKGYEEAKDRGTLGDQGYETAKVTGPFYHTLDPDAPSDSSYMTVSRSNQDGGYDALDRQQDSNQAKSKTDSGYDVTGRIGKGDIKVEPSNQTDNDYSAISRGSANTSGYDKLDHTRRSYEVDSISPNDYNVLQPQEA